jgi:hypothetical protein
MSVAVAFLRDMFGASTKEPVYLSSLANADAPASEVRERHAMLREPELVDRFIERYDRPNRGLFFCVATVRTGSKTRSKTTIAELALVHADIDFNKIVETPQEVEQRLTEAEFLPTCVVASGNGLHAYWVFREALPATSENKTRVEALLRLLSDYWAPTRPAPNARG